MKITLAAAMLFAAILLRAQAPAVPHGTLSGVVVEKKTGAPVKKAVVILQRDEQEGIGVTTDAEGKFTFHDADPGSYTINVERDGYILQRDTAQKVVTVNAGSNNSDLKLTLLRTGVISGRVMDTDGEPLANARVQITPLRMKASQFEGNGAMTDDRGEYRAFHVAPGEYRVSVAYDPASTFHRVHLEKLQDAYTLTYYSGPVKVESGAELHGIDIQMVRAHAVLVKGRLVGSPGIAMVGLQLANHQGGGEHNTIVQNAIGEFELPGVLPGRYLLTAVMMDFGGEGKLTGRQIVDVGDVNVENLQITLGIPQKVTGSFTVPDGRKLLPGLMVVLGGRSHDDSSAGGFAKVAEDGSFTMKDVVPGDYDLLIQTTGASDDLYISSIKMGEADVLADGVHVGDNAPAPLEIVLKPNGGSATCSVVDDKGVPVPLAQVELIPDAPKNHQLALYGGCKTESNGTCKITGITPGDYHVFAFRAGTQSNYQDPELFKTYEANGKAMNSIESQEQQVQVTVIAAE